MDHNLNGNEEETEATHIKLKALLDETLTEYTLIEHQPVKTSEEAAVVRNTTIESGAKAMIVKADKQHYLLVISAKLKFDSKKVKKLVKAKSLKFADLSEVKELTGCLNGAVPPFGSLFGIQTLTDESLFTQGDTITFNAGLRTKSIIMKGADYKTVENPLIVNICE